MASDSRLDKIMKERRLGLDKMSRSARAFEQPVKVFFSN